VYRIGIDLQLFSGGVDDSNKDMDSGFLMDVSALYKLRDNVSILAEAKNILDQKYEKYTNYAAEELQIIFGVKMTF
jgi:outer membrane cobalamin receptor